MILISYSFSTQNMTLIIDLKIEYEFEMLNIRDY
jgi:hypothetical protein